MKRGLHINNIRILQKESNEPEMRLKADFDS